MTCFVSPLDDLPCKMDKERGVYGGEDMMYEFMADNGAHCQRECQYHSECVMVSCVVLPRQNRCILYSQGQFVRTYESNSNTWEKTCPGK